MNLFLALASAMVLGSADFVGGLAAKNARAFVVVMWSNVAGLITALALVGVLSRSGTSWHEALWGGLAGLCGSAGAMILYHALAHGVMSLVAPTTAAAAAALPVLAGVLTGDRLSSLAVLGVICALASVLLVSLSGSEHQQASNKRKLLRSLGLALLAGAGFGAFFVFLAHTPSDSSMWPLVWARCASLSLLVLIALAQRRSPRLAVQPGRLALLSGVLDMGSSALFLVAVQDGSLAVVGLLASLYPISTLILARVVLKERIRPIQQFGVALAVGSVVLLSWN